MSSLKEKVRKREVKRLIERLYCQYINGTEYPYKDFKDEYPEIESIYIEINSFYIYVEFETSHASQQDSYCDGIYYDSDEVDRFERALGGITAGNIQSQAKKIIPKGNRYMVQLYFSNKYEIEALE